MAKDFDFDSVLSDAKAGSSVALGALYREFNPALRRFLVARLPSEGEDLAADVWVAVAPKIREFTGDERGFRAWLFTFGRRRLIDHFRKSGRRGPVVALHEQQDQPARDDPEAEALAHLSAAEAAQLLQAHLTVDQCDVLTLRIYGGLDVSEVAAAMEHTDTWVRVTQHRAIQRLSKRLGSQMDVTQ
jgi:RNA polymerase sigma-70 factor (ECF subfamily)